MELLRRFVPQFILLGIICLIATFGYIKAEIAQTNATLDTSKTIIIDAGHGGLTNTID